MDGPHDSPDNGDPPTSPSESDVDTETVRALRDPLRRFTLYALDGRQLSVDAMVDAVTAWHATSEGRMATRDDRERVGQALQDTHLSMLETAGLVEHDREEGTVALASLSEPVRQLVSRSYREDGSNQVSDSPPAVPSPDAFDRGERLSPGELSDLAGFLSAVERRRQTITVYAPELPSGVVTQFSDRNTVLEYEQIPPDGPPGFLLVRTDDGFVGSTGLGALERLSRPTAPNEDEDPALEATERALLGLLEESLFASLDRRQLLVAAREIEDRALRVGTGTLWVGFQAFSKLWNQLPLYRRLAAETALTIHVYGQPDWEPPSLENVAYHSDLPDVGEFWFVAFNGGGNPAQASALVAEERLPGEFYGCWTYDPDLIDALLGWLIRQY